MSVIIHRKLMREGEGEECMLCGTAIGAGMKGILVIVKAGIDFETNGEPQVLVLCFDCGREIGKAAKG